MNESINFIAIPENQLRQLIREELNACQKLGPIEPIKDPFFTLEQLQDYIQARTNRRPARQTVYDLIYKRKIPFVKFSKYCYFRRSEIDHWLENGRQMNQ